MDKKSQVKTEQSELNRLAPGDKEGTTELSAEVKQRIIRKALLSRKVEESLFKLYAQNKISGTIHTCIGQEFSGAVVTEYLKPGDSVFSNHRCHGHFLSFTADVKGLIAEIMGKETGVCAGRGGSQHLCKNDFYSNGIQGGIVPIAAGLSFARKIKENNRISVVFIGDGTLGEGVIYETFNMVSKWELPLLVILENNGYAQSTNQNEVLAGEIAKRAEVFGIRTSCGDTWDWQKLATSAEELTNYVRSESKPGFLQIDTFRLKAHSKGDDNREKQLIEHYETIDPLNIILADQSLDMMAISKEIDFMITEAIELADKAPFQSFQESTTSPITNRLVWEDHQYEEKSIQTILNEIFSRLMQADDRIFFIGEDIRSPYGGAFKVTAGLSDLFPDRVINSPISEAAIVGMGCGLALEGFFPFIEIMFGDFLTLAFDQIINHLSKFSYMYNNAVHLNLVIRTPMGGGRGYGPTHSQTLDRHFLGIPGINIVALNNLLNPELIYKSILNLECGPTIVIENKRLYNQILQNDLPPGFKRFVSQEAFPTVHIRPHSEKVDITLFGYGGLSQDMVSAADILFDEYDLVTQVICPTLIYPFEVKPLLEIISQGQWLVFVEEGQGFAGFGAEVISKIAEQNPNILKNILRIVPAETPIPAAIELEKKALPNTQTIVSKILNKFFQHKVTKDTGKEN